MTETKAQTKKPGAFAGFLDSRFHITERGSDIGTEVRAGLGAFCVAVCALLLNTQVIGTYYGNYAGSYFAICLTALLGTALIGIFCNLPLIQTASLSLSSLMVAYLGSNTGLTYANLLFVTFLSAIITLVILVTPLKKIFLDAVPDGVKKGIPAGLGLYVILYSLKDCGLITQDGSLAFPGDLTETMDKVYYWIMIAGIGLVVLYLAAKRVNALGSTYFMLIAAMWVIGIVFFMEDFVGGQTATTLVYQRVNLIVATDGAHPYTIGSGISSLNAGLLFSQGTDFSAFTEAGGNVALFLLQSIATFVLMGLYMGAGTVQAAAAAGDMEDGSMEKGTVKVLAVTQVTNILSAVLGGTPQAPGTESAMNTKDGAKTGLSSLAAGIGFLIALFNWIFFAIAATTTNGVGMWINDTETKLAAYVQDKFAFASLIMVFAGAAMLKGAKKVDVKALSEFVPFLVSLTATAFAGNAVLGAALGIAAYLILKVCDKTRKQITAAQVVLTAVLICYVIITIKYGNNFITAVQMMGPGGPMG